MEESTTVVPSDLYSLRSRIQELKEIHKSEEIISPEQADKLFHESALEIEATLDQILSDTSDISSLSLEDVENFLDHLRKELSSAEGENAKVESEIQDLLMRYTQDYSKLENELEGLSCSLDFLESQVMAREKLHVNADHSTRDKVEENLPHPDGGSEFKIMELNHQIENKKNTIRALKDFDDKFKWLDALEKLDDAFSGIKVVEIEGNHIRLSLRTYIPSVGSVLSLQRTEDISEPSEQNHGLLIELIEGTMQIKNAEIFPSDIYISEIVDATRSLRTVLSPVLEARSSLEWFVRRVQDQIVLSTIRRFVVKHANNSRYSLEYVDKEEMIIAHLMGGLDVLIKVAYGWPIVTAALSVMSLKSSSINSNDTYAGSLYELARRANSLETHIRENISSFVDRIEEILSQQMAAEVV